MGYTRRQPGAEAVTWIDGDTAAVEGAGDVDLVVSIADIVEAILAEAGLNRKRVRPRCTSSPIGRSLERVHRSCERWM